MISPEFGLLAVPLPGGSIGNASNSIGNLMTELSAKMKDLTSLLRKEAAVPSSGVYTECLLHGVVTNEKLPRVMKILEACSDTHLSHQWIDVHLENKRIALPELSLNTRISPSAWNSLWVRISHPAHDLSLSPDHAPCSIQFVGRGQPAHSRKLPLQCTVRRVFEASSGAQMLKIMERLSYKPKFFTCSRSSIFYSKFGYSNPIMVYAETHFKDLEASERLSLENNLVTIISRCSDEKNIEAVDQAVRKFSANISRYSKFRRIDSLDFERRN